MNEEENVICLGTRGYGRSYVQALNEIKSLKQQLKDKDEKISKMLKKLTLIQLDREVSLKDITELVSVILESNKED